MYANENYKNKCLKMTETSKSGDTEIGQFNLKPMNH